MYLGRKISSIIRSCVNRLLQADEHWFLSEPQEQSEIEEVEIRYSVLLPESVCEFIRQVAQLASLIMVIIRTAH